MKFEFVIFGRRHAQQAGIQVLQIRGSCIDALGHQAQIHRIIDLDDVVRQAAVSGVKVDPARTARDSWP